MEGETKNIEELAKDFVGRLKFLSPKELLSYAIKNEEEEAEYYSRLASISKRLSVRILFLKMSEESREHEKVLRNLFEKLFPGEKPVEVDIPAVEVLPVYDELKGSKSYIEALQACMKSELLAKTVYELLSQTVEDDEVREIAMALAAMEERHYEELRKVYELILDMDRRRLTPRSLKPGAYLFTDREKAHYFLVDFVDWSKRLYAIVRDNPCELDEKLSGRIEKIVWVTKVDEEGPFEVISPKEISVLRKDLSRFFKRLGDNKGVVFIENLGYMVFELGFTDMMDFVLYVKDLAIINDGYLIVTAIPEAFEKKEWAILTSELELIS